MNRRDAVQMALEALDGIYPGNMTPMAEANWRVATDYLRAALAEPEPEPVAYIRGTVAGYQIIEPFDPAVVLPESAAVYLHPPQRKPLSAALAVEDLQFLTDVVTAAGLLYHGKKDKGLSERISKHAFQVRLNPPQRKPLSQDQLREIFLAAGFTIKEGQTDLKPYVYSAARLIEAAHNITGETK